MKRFTMPDGCALAYREAEGPGRTAILVHGWCCDHGFFEPQFAHFAALGWRVIGVDLRGHGDSDKPEGRYAIATFADDLAALCGHAGIAAPVVIGHSMGGIVAYDLAVRHPGLASAIVMIDSAVTAPPAVRALFGRVLEALAGPDYRAVMRNVVETALFLQTDDPARRAWILARMSATPQHVMRAAYAGLRDFDADDARRIEVPALYIAAGEPVPRTDLGRLRSLVPHLAVERVAGVGHFCQLEAPDLVNAMLDRFLEAALPPE